MDEKISESFGEIFRNYDLLKNYGDKIDYLQSWRFSEDDLLRLFYHYFAYTKIQEYSLPGAYNFDIGSEDVFGHFLKDSCDNLKRDPENLNNFMEEFLEEFDDFVSCFKELMKNTNKKKEVKKIFNFLGPNANMYPLIISLKKKGWLDEEMFNILESLDVRVYKIRGTNPRADLYKETISQLKNGLTKTEAKENLKDFIEDWMPIPQLKNNLNENIYPNPALNYILWEYEKEKKESFDGWDYDYYKELQIDHIFPQEEKIVFPGDGFEDEEEYISNKHKIGNLCLLEEDKNQQAKNKVPKKKSKFYRKSDVPGTRKIGIHIENKGINKKYIQERTEKIRDFCVNRWSIK
ncbi:MAG: HNH endonuclease family protein [Thermoplasmatota archaeon]